ncbi:MAG TPA: hypothetical protein VF390_01955 [Patescibacteria group bacterium]
MVAKGRIGLWITLGGIVIWIAMKKLAAYLGLLNLFWMACGIVVLLVAYAFVWKPRFREEPDPGEEEKIAA